MQLKDEDTSPSLSTKLIQKSTTPNFTSKINMPCQKKLKSQNKEDQQLPIANSLHKSIWPKYDLEHFKKLLDANPEEINCTFGGCFETPLHR